MPLAGLEPKALWRHFDEIRKIPHCSGNEAALAAYILDFAKKNGFEAKRDRAGNVIVRVSASTGKEKAPIVVLQGHMDMVCEKDSEVEHDFTKDPIELVRDGEWVMARGTTLGADNGVGVAAALAVAEEQGIEHGPLELLFTVDEEVGLTGAGKLTPGSLEGRILLNLDSEELGALYIGCAGGGDSTLKLPVSRTKAPAGATTLRVAVGGLKGGHSGIDIHEQRGNAIRILARLLRRASKRVDIRLVSIAGGNKRNAIPRDAKALVAVRRGEEASLREAMDEEREAIALELGKADPGLQTSVEEHSEEPVSVMDGDSTATTLALLLALPHGVEAMSLDVPGLVETSNNLATVESKEREVVIGTSSRSSIATALEALRERIRAAGELAGARVEEHQAYPGWKPDPASHLLTVVRRVHSELFGAEPQVKAIHAGLECGIIREKFPGMEMISFGPLIENPHSPKERVHGGSVAQFWKLLAGVLEELAC